jgi:hypothetical protein
MPKTRIVATPTWRYPVAAHPGYRPGNPNWVPGHHQPGGVPFTAESRAVMTEPPNSPGPRFSSLIRRATDEGAELVTFMLAVLRDDVARLLPPELTDEQVARIAEARHLVETREPKRKGRTRSPAALARQIAKRRAKVHKQLRRRLNRAISRRITLTDRARAARWLTDRGYGKAPIALEIKDGGPVRVDLSALEAGEIRTFLALMDKVRIGPQAGAVGATAAPSSEQSP